MKIKQEHYKRLEQDLIKHLKHYNITFNQLVINVRETKRFTHNPVIAAAWELYHKSQSDKHFVDELYSYLNDNHIETALLNIVKTIDDKIPNYENRRYHNVVI